MTHRTLRRQSLPAHNPDESGRDPLASTVNLSAAEKRLLLDIARESIRSQGSLCPETLKRIPTSGPLCDAHSVFVTLRKLGKLRGCIGHVAEDHPLWQSTLNVARQSASSDPRFEAVEPAELDNLSIEISVLSTMAPVSSWEDIHIGKDGLLVEGRGRRGLLLPQVASDRDWTAETFLSETCRKAGLAPDCWKADGDVRISRFQALVFSDSETTPNHIQED